MRIGRLALKIYLYSIVAVLAAVGMFVAAVATLESGRRHDMVAVSGHIVRSLWHLHRHLDPAAPTTAAQLSHVFVTLYQRDGQLLTSTASPPLPTPSGAQTLELEEKGFVEIGHGVIAHQVRDGGRPVGVGVVAFRFPALGGLVPPLLVPLGALLIIAVMFGRHLARPLQYVANVARRFGRGDLGARVGSGRNDEIGQVGVAFDAMADRVTGLMAAQQELMANVSHELRTPLSRIQVAVDLMTDGKTDRVKELLPDIANDLAEVERLVDDVMTVAKLDLSRSQGPASVLPLHLEPLAIEPLIEDAASRFRSLHRTHDLVVEVAPGLPELSVDGVLLRRVLDNLLENARKYSDAGTAIRLSADHAPTTGVTVTIADSGIGIDEADLQHVFTPFYRCDKSRSRTTGGVGLGLALARRVVEANGGAIEIASKLGSGTTVSLNLPVVHRVMAM